MHVQNGANADLEVVAGDRELELDGHLAAEGLVEAV